MPSNPVLRTMSLIAALILSPAAFAGEALDAAALKALIVGKTVSGHHEFRDFDFQVYFAPNGDMVRVIDGDETEGTYRITSRGEHCIELGHIANCATVEDNGDGTYTRVLSHNGKRPITWHAFTEGRAR